MHQPYANSSVGDIYPFIRTYHSKGRIMKKQFLSTAERGQSMIEYALILSLIAVVSIITLSIAGTSIRDIFSDVVDGLQSNVTQIQPDQGDQGQQNDGQEDQGQGDQDQGDQDQQDQGQQDEGQQDEDQQTDEHEGEQCQVKKTAKWKTTYYLFTKHSGEWQYTSQSKWSFNVSNCPAGTME